ncbi:hypothetical protein [Anabaena sp. 4-3]|uniref:hypothetical protein n=1 Tax=Anabaena sp. 4-3 TaxID=1811979 RepID=UPI0008339FA0|nr:hypothetical protein [Anabaena sp. 4-3]
MKNGKGVITENGNGVKPQIQARNLLGKFVSSVQLLVEDITALEVNTMVVDKITATKFNAWDAYQEIYCINDADYFHVKGIPDSAEMPDEDIQHKCDADNLCKRYKSLFAQLEREYFYCLLDAEDNLNEHQRQKIERYYQRLELLKKQQAGEIIETDPEHIELGRPILPHPSPILDNKNGQVDENGETWPERRAEIQEMLHNDKFVRTLRKISELKAALDGGDIHSTDIDVIYAQTVMQLDGDIITRYHKDLFTLSEDAKNLILKAHNEGVVAGEKQWRGTLNFLMGLVQSIANFTPNER